MRYIATADTDIGIAKSTNQDSVLIKHIHSAWGEVLLAVVCDGMGGLAKGELASATVIRAFCKWFDEELPQALENLDMEAVGRRWTQMLQQLNEQIGRYGNSQGAALGTTFSGLLLAQGQYLIGQVGDSRVYHLGTELRQLTTDQSFVAREVSRGNMTPEQAKVDKRRNLLLQCVGASKTVVPEILCGEARPGAYMLCSDGFVHEVQDAEIYGALNPAGLQDRADMHAKAQRLIELVKSRMEKDNISVLLVKAEEAPAVQPVAQNPTVKKPGKGRLVPFLIAAILCVTMLLSGVFFGARADKAQAKAYEKLLVQMQDASVEDAIEACREASELRPEDPRAYLALQAALAEADTFGPEEIRELQALYWDNSHAFDAKDPDVALLRYRMGLLYLNNYDRHWGKQNPTAVRAALAQPFLADNANNEKLLQEFEKEPLNAAFYNSCSLFSSGIIQATQKGTEVSDGELVMQTLTAMVETADGLKAADPYDRLSAYSLASSMLCDCAEGLAAAQCDPNVVMHLFDTIYQKAEGITAEDPQQAKLRNEIIDDYSDRREAIVTAFGILEAEEGE